jgi:hypothetical protein
MQPIPHKVLKIQLGYNPVSTNPEYLDTKKRRFGREQMKSNGENRKRKNVEGKENELCCG